VVDDPDLVHLHTVGSHDGGAHRHHARGVRPLGQRLERAVEEQGTPDDRGEPDR
jgi:hypothetical protein